MFGFRCLVVCLFIYYLLKSGIRSVAQQGTNRLLRVKELMCSSDGDNLRKGIFKGQDRLPPQGSCRCSRKDLTNPAPKEVELAWCRKFKTGEVLLMSSTTQNSQPAVGSWLLPGPEGEHGTPFSHCSCWMCSEKPGEALITISVGRCQEPF